MRMLLLIAAVVVLAYGIAVILGAFGTEIGSTGLVMLLAVSALALFTVVKLRGRAHG